MAEQPDNKPAADQDHGAESFIQEQLATMPEPQPHAIEAARAEAAQAPQAAGEVFDAAIHATNQDGTPKLKSDGTFARKRGRKAGASILNAPKPKDNAANSQQPATAETQAAALGIASANLVILCGMMVGGKDFAPDEKNALLGVPDKEMLEGAFRDYYVATGKQDLPPGLTLCVAILAYAAPKFSRPTVLERFKKFGAWVSNWRKKK